MFVPALCFISGTGSTKNKSLALGPKVGLHGSMPLLPVGASENWDHLVKSAGHSDSSCWESMESASECNIGQERKEVHLALVKALCQQLYSRLGHNQHNLAPDCTVAVTWLCRSSTRSSLSSTASS